MGMINLRSWVLSLWPEPPRDPGEVLKHTVVMHGSTPDSDMAVQATCNIYGNGVQTGLTYGDLRKLADLIASLKEDSDTLAALEAAGVDNWSGYDSAMEILRGGEPA